MRLRRERERKMKKTICKVEYDTENAELIQKKTSGVFGDPAGYEECLYKTQDGKEETIKRMSAVSAKAWQKA